VFHSVMLDTDKTVCHRGSDIEDICKLTSCSLKSVYLSKHR